MKHFKMLLGILGAILILPTIVVFVSLFAWIIGFISTVEILNTMMNIFVYFIMGTGMYVITLDAYKGTIKYLETHFKCFGKDKK